MQQLENEQVGHDVNRGSRVRQSGDDVPNPLLGPHRQSDKDDLNLSGASLLQQALGVSQTRVQFFREFSGSLVRPVVEETDKPQAQFGLVANVPREFNSQIIDSDDGKARE
jgi:hypothetical protein